MSFLRPHSFLYTKARLIFSVHKDVHCFSFLEIIQMSAYMHTHLIISQNFVWLFSYIYWLPQRPKTGCTGNFFFEIRIYHGETYFNTHSPVILGCSVDTWMLMWGHAICLTFTPALVSDTTGLNPIPHLHVMCWAPITLGFHWANESQMQW